jgi:hypothetical protein
MRTSDRDLPSAEKSNEGEICPDRRRLNCGQRGGQCGGINSCILRLRLSPLGSVRVARNSAKQRASPRPRLRTEGRKKFSLLSARNPLKSHESEERIQGKARKNKAQLRRKARKIQEKQRICKFPAAHRAAASVNYGKNMCITGCDGLGPLAACPAPWTSRFAKASVEPTSGGRGDQISQIRGFRRRHTARRVFDVRRPRRRLRAG